MFLFLLAYCDFERLLGSGSAPMAREAMVSAAVRYFSISTGEMVRMSPMLSKPLPESSVGKSLFGAEVDAEQIADGVGVLVAVEAAGGDAAGIGLDVAVGLFEFAPAGIG